MDFFENIAYDCKNKKIYCYGAGNYGKLFSYKLKEMNLNFMGFVVSDNSREAKNGIKHVLGKPVYILNEIIDKKDCIFLVCINHNYIDEVINNLKSCYVENYIVIDEKIFEKLEKTMTFSSCNNSGKNIDILLYHRVANVKNDRWNLAVSPAVFEEHICYLKENYKILRFEDDWSQQKEKCIVITFDDGYADNYFNAFPILEKYKVPATFFVATEYINTNSFFWWDEIYELIAQNKKEIQNIKYENNYFDLRAMIEKEKFVDYVRNEILKSDLEGKRRILEYLRSTLGEIGRPDVYSKAMNKEQIRKMSNSNCVTFGAHTKTHHRLSSLSYGEQLKEIEESKRKLEEIIQKKVDVFSYPFGCDEDFDENSVEAVKRTGFLKAAAVNGGLFKCGEDSEFVIPRNTVKGGTDLSLLINQINRHWTEY